jgi:hypothetical protein
MFDDLVREDAVSNELIPLPIDFDRKLPCLRAHRIFGRNDFDGPPGQYRIDGAQHAAGQHPRVEAGPLVKPEDLRLVKCLRHDVAELRVELPRQQG